LDFNVSGIDAEEEELALSHRQMELEMFSQVCRTIGSHPLLSHVKRLNFEDNTGNQYADNVLPMADVVGELFEFLRSLDELIIQNCDLRIFLAPFINIPEFRNLRRRFPHVKELILSEVCIVDAQQCLDGIVELAKSQHELGKPFELVLAEERVIPAATVVRLRQWVGTAYCGEV
jgi:hypothetical protein